MLSAAQARCGRKRSHGQAVPKSLVPAMSLVPATGGPPMQSPLRRFEWRPKVSGPPPSYLCWANKGAVLLSMLCERDCCANAVSRVKCADVMTNESVQSNSA